MTYANLSIRYQITIPKEICRKLQIKPKQKFVVLEKGGVIHLIPDIPIEKMKGFFKNLQMDSDLRDKKVNNISSF